MLFKGTACHHNNADISYKGMTTSEPHRWKAYRAWEHPHRETWPLQHRRKNQSMEYDIPQEDLLPQTSIVIKVATYIANSWVLLIDQTIIKKSKVNFIAFMNLHCLYVVIVMMYWYKCIYSNCHVKTAQIPWKQWSSLQKSFSSLFDQSRLLKN